MDATVFNAKTIERKMLEKANKGKHKLVWLNTLLDTGPVEFVKTEAIIVSPNDNVSAPIIEKLKNRGVKYIAAYSTGTHHIDVGAAAKCGIKVANAPIVSPNAVAEHAVALLLTLLRKIREADKRVHELSFDLEGLTGAQLNEKTVGIMGAGQIGSVMARIMHGFGCRILMYNRSVKQNLVEKYELEFTSFENLVQQSDVISIHLPLVGETKHLLNGEAFNKMKPGVIIINTARGEIIETSALVKALQDGRVGAAGLDVYEFEKDIFYKNDNTGPLKDPLLAYLLGNPYVLITAHQAYATETTIRQRAQSVIDTLEKWDRGERPEYQVI
jgi:D-lactate dehydrogenase